MKANYIATLVLCLLVWRARAQQDTLEISPRDLADSIYGQLTPSNIPSGRLFNRMFKTDSMSICEHFQQNTTDTASADYLYDALVELRFMSYDSSSFIDPYQVFLNAQHAYAGYEFDDEQIVIPLGLIDYNYQTVNDSMLQQNNLQFYDNGVNSSLAFSTKRVQMIAPMFDYVSDETMYLLIKEEWLLKDNELTVQSVEVNTGNGWETINFDELFPFTPQNSETQTLYARLTYDNGESVESTILLHTPGLSEPREKSDFACDLEGQLSDNSGNNLQWCLLYGCQEGANSNVLDKPFILVTGYRPPIIDQKFKKTYKIYDGHQNGYIKQLRSRGYDVFFVRFNMYNNLNQTMEDEGDLLARFINEYVNANKVDHYENVVQGCSMGSDIVSYALMKMEYNHLHNNAPHPHTREFIAFDADFYGANLPLSFQYIIYSKFYNPVGSGSSGLGSQFLGFFMYNVLEQKVTKELLMYHALGSNGNVKPFPYNFFAQHDIVPVAHPYRDGFLYNLSLYDTHQKFIPLPTATRNVAVSLGKISTTDDVNPPQHIFFRAAGEPYVDMAISLGSYQLEEYYLAPPEYRTSDYFKLFERKNSLTILGLPFLFCHQRMSVKYMQEIDNSSGSYLGGTGNIINVAEGAYGLLDAGHPYETYFSHKPVVTALAINKNLWPSSGSMTLNIQDLGLMNVGKTNSGALIPSNFYGYPNVGRPNDHFNITPFEAIYVDNEIDQHIDLKGKQVDSLNTFLLNEIQPEVLSLQNGRLGATARSNYTYIAKRTANVIRAGYDVTPTTDKGDYVVQPNAYLTLEACDEIVFEPGFSTEWGGQLDASIVCELCIQQNGMAQNNTSQHSSNGEQASKENASLPTYVSQNEQQEEHIKIFPNPNNGSFTLELPNSCSGGSLYISDVLGKEVYRQAIEQQHAELQLNLPKGVYYLRYADTKHVETQQIIIQ